MKPRRGPEARLKREIEYFRERVKLTAAWKTIRQHQAFTRAVNCLRVRERMLACWRQHGHLAYWSVKA